MMKVRKPPLDFSQVPVFWSHNREFAQRWNAGSLVPAYIEPFLVKVLHEAKPLLTETGPLKDDVDIFIKQEMEHCKNHIKFNRRFAQFGYDELKPVEAAYAADYDRWMKTKSLRFRLAYCEGFEAMSAISVSAIFEEADEFLEGADQQVVDLWKWHLAEEYEHRAVMHDVFHVLYGRNPISCYFWRIYGFFYAVRHIGTFANNAADVLLAKDRQGLSPEALALSIANEKRAKAALARPALHHLLQILSPFYKPAKRKPPRGVEAYLGPSYPGPAPLATAA
jgi:predicted metal-dependent hydrolase